MLRQLWSQGFSAENLIFILSGVFVLFVSLPFHELAHAWMAEKMGDSTARYAGRLTLNPFAHMDPVGMLMILFFGFGWAKPVPVSYSRFRDFRKGVALTALAGPVSNLLLALAICLVTQFIQFIPFSNTVTADYFYLFFYYIVLRNIMLAVFNLIPVPPLDGSKVASALLPDRWYRYYEYVERYAFIFLVFVVLSDRVGRFLYVASTVILNFFWWLTGLPFALFA